MTAWLVSIARSAGAEKMRGGVYTCPGLWYGIYYKVTTTKGHTMPLAIFFLVLNVGCAMWAFSDGNSIPAIISAAGAVFAMIWIAFLVEDGS